MVTITEDQKKHFSQWFIANSEWGALEKMIWLVDKINQLAAVNADSSLAQSILTNEQYESLKFHPTSDLSKAVKFLRSNNFGLAIGELINHETKQREQSQSVSQSIVGSERISIGQHFNPFLASSLSKPTGINQSIVRSSGLQIGGSFTPQISERTGSEVLPEPTPTLFTPQQQEKDFLIVKGHFLTARSYTIEKLQMITERWAKMIDRNEVANKVGIFVSSVGAATQLPTFGVPALLGEIIKVAANFSLKRSSTTLNKEFLILTLDNEETTNKLGKCYDDLIDFYRTTETKQNWLGIKPGDVWKVLPERLPLFGNYEYLIEEILRTEGIWKGQIFNSLNEIKQVYTCLQKNYLILEQQWSDQMNKVEITERGWIHNQVDYRRKSSELQQLQEIASEDESSLKKDLRRHSLLITLKGQEKLYHERIESLFDELPANSHDFKASLQEKPLGRRLRGKEIDKIDGFYNHRSELNEKKNQLLVEVNELQLETIVEVSEN